MGPRSYRLPLWARKLLAFCAFVLLCHFSGRFLQRWERLALGIADLEARMPLELCVATYQAISAPDAAQCTAALRDTHGHVHELAECPEQCMSLANALVERCLGLETDRTATQASFQDATQRGHDGILELSKGSIDPILRAHEEWRVLGNACGIMEDGDDHAVAATNTSFEHETMASTITTNDVCIFCDPVRSN